MTKTNEASSPPRGAPLCANGMRATLSLTIERPQPAGLVWLIEPDRRRGAIGLHVGTGRPGSDHLTTAVWLEPEAAEAMAYDLLQAAASWRAEQPAPSLALVQGAAQ